MTAQLEQTYAFENGISVKKKRINGGIVASSIILKKGRFVAAELELPKTVFSIYFPVSGSSSVIYKSVAEFMRSENGNVMYHPISLNKSGQSIDRLPGSCTKALMGFVDTEEVEASSLSRIQKCDVVDAITDRSKILTTLEKILGKGAEVDEVAGYFFSFLIGSHIYSDEIE